MIATFMAVLVALFGEQARRWLMRPKVCISWEKAGLMFQSDQNVPLEQDTHHVRLKVINSGKESALNVQCVLQSIRTWHGDKWVRDDNFMPRRLYWALDENDLLPTLQPETFSLLELGRFVGLNPHVPTQFGVYPRHCHVLPAGRHDLEFILTSDHHLHYHGFFELNFDETRDPPTSDRFVIKESRRIKSD